jgi:hypothetical protein
MIESFKPFTLNYVKESFGLVGVQYRHLSVLKFGLIHRTGRVASDQTPFERLVEGSMQNSVDCTYRGHTGTGFLLISVEALNLIGP